MSSRRRGRAVPRGFTLVEILVVLAIMALIGAMLAPAVNALLRGISQPAPERIVWDAITAARARALEVNRTVWLRVGSENRQLSWDDGDQSGRQELPSGIRLQFLEPWTAERMLIGGMLVETRAIPAVRFFPDGTCEPFRVQIQQASGAPVVFAVDPWTCAAILNPEKK